MRLLRALPSSHGYPGRDGKLYPDPVDFCVCEVREAYAAGEFDADELEERAHAAVRGDAVRATGCGLPFQLQTVWR